MERKLQVIRVDLKYCEACGALWMRPRGSSTRYCRRCAARMAQLSRSVRRKPAEGKRP